MCFPPQQLLSCSCSPDNLCKHSILVKRACLWINVTLRLNCYPAHISCTVFYPWKKRERDRFFLCLENYPMKEFKPTFLRRGFPKLLVPWWGNVLQRIIELSHFLWQYTSVVHSLGENWLFLRFECFLSFPSFQHSLMNFIVCFLTGSWYVAQVGLNLLSSGLNFPSPDIIGVHRQA